MSDVSLNRSSNGGFIVNHWNDDDNDSFITFNIDEALGEVKRILETSKKVKDVE